MNPLAAPKTPTRTDRPTTRTELLLIRGIAVVHMAFPFVSQTHVFIEHVWPSRGVLAVFNWIGFIILTPAFVSLTYWVCSSLWHLKRWARVVFVVWDSLWVTFYIGGFLYVFGILQTTPDPYEFFTQSAGALFAASSLIVLTRTRAFRRPASAALKATPRA
jgi:hypothetical protein